MREVSFPLVAELYLAERNVRIAVGAWWRRRFVQFHISFIRGPAGFTTVTGGAGTDYIFPGMLTSPIAGNHMVEGKLSGLSTAVLAGMLVSVENFGAA